MHRAPEELKNEAELGIGSERIEEFYDRWRCALENIENGQLGSAKAGVGDDLDCNISGELGIKRADDTRKDTSADLTRDLLAIRENGA
jgi:hypothetical protein